MIVTYDTGTGLPYVQSGNYLIDVPNTSSRISGIDDSRGFGQNSYIFFYNRTNYAVPHLTSYSGATQSESGSGITFTTGSQEPPFGTDPNFSGATTTFLTQATIGYAQPWQFTYDSAGAGELQSVIFPFGGEIAWNYSSFAYTGSRSMREVSGRYLAPDALHATNPMWSYGVSRPDAPNSVTVHSGFTLSDASGVGAKTWSFNTTGSPWQLGLISDFKQLTAANGTVLHDDQYTWSQDPAGHPYISAHTSITDPGTSYAQSALTTQTLDQYGNATQSVTYPYNNTTTPLKTYNNTYLSSTNYTSHYIFNLLSTSSLTPAGGSPITLVTNYWDWSGWISGPFGGSVAGGWYQSAPFPTTEYDANPPVPYGSRGYLTASVTPAKATATVYYAYGAVDSTSDTTGATATASADSATNYAAPQTITTQSYTTTIGYTSWLGVAQTTGPNGDQLRMAYDQYGRPTSGTSAYGAVTTFSYNTSAPFTQTESGPSGVTITTLDGFGRAVLVQKGDSTTPDTTTSYSASVYAPCACSPLGKLQKVSMPYPSGGSASAWTTYTYDGLGRTVSQQKPDGASTTNYNYAGNQTTVTDPAGKWKTTTTDVLGNLTQVLEPDPANQPGGTVTTNYTYDWMGHVTQVSMPRAGTTQTRTFVYDGGGRLTSATNPENGTVTYTYNTTNTLASKTDAKGQQTAYTYDSKNRVTMLQRYPRGVSYGEDLCQRVTYTYDTNPVNANFSQYSTGRLTTVQYYGQNANSNGGGCGQNPPPPANLDSYAYDIYTEMYSYLPGGAVTAKNVSLTRELGYLYVPYSPVSLEVDYTYDSAGRTLTTTYPMTFQTGYNAQPVMTTGYDAMGRPSTLTDTMGDPGSAGSYPPTNWVSGVQYDYAGRLSNMSWLYNAGGYGGNSTSESRTYNVNGQLASINWGWPAGSYGVWAIQYNYSATQNNGQITQEVDNGTQTTSYQYDVLKRLASASGSWTQTYQYDGYGNLTGRVLNGTSTPIPVNAATNQLTNAYYDANGNMTSGAGATFTYDEANRVTTVTETSGGEAFYGYDASNKRIYERGGNVGEVFIFYGAKGENLGRYAILPNACTGGSVGICLQPQVTNLYFAGRVVTTTPGSAVFQDRLGTYRTGTYYPYGEGVAGSDTLQFATYTRDSYTGLDYANQRFYASAYGRFLTADRRRGKRRNPGSFNRYAYALGDPVNHNDPRGLTCVNVDGVWQDNGDGSGCSDEGLGVDYSSLGDLIATVNVDIYDDQDYSPDDIETALACVADPGDPTCLQASSQYAGITTRQIVQQACNALPDGRSIGLSGALGLLGGPTGSVELVLDYDTGQAYLAGSLGVSLVNGGASAGVSLGFIFGSGDSVPNYISGGNTSASVNGFGGLGVSVSANSGGLNAPTQLNFGSATSVQLNYVASLLDLLPVSGSVAATNNVFSIPLGSFITGPASALATSFDQPFYQAQQACATYLGQ